MWTKAQSWIKPTHTNTQTAECNQVKSHHGAGWCRCDLIHNHWCQGDPRHCSATLLSFSGQLTLPLLTTIVANFPWCLDHLPNFEQRPCLLLHRTYRGCYKGTSCHKNYTPGFISTQPHTLPIKKKKKSLSSSPQLCFDLPSLIYCSGYSFSLSLSFKANFSSFL